MTDYDTSSIDDNEIEYVPVHRQSEVRVADILVSVITGSAFNFGNKKHNE